MLNNQERKAIKTYKDLIVFQLSYKLAIDIFQMTKTFPKDETYSLTSQIRRSSRSVPANIAEGWAKRKYENVFFKHLLDSTGSCEETKLWLDFSRDCQYMTKEESDYLLGKYMEVGAMLNSLLNKWQTYGKD